MIPGTILTFLGQWWKPIVAVAAAIALLYAIVTVKGCVDASRNAAQSKVNAGQQGAYQNSAGDAISTQGNVADNATASEALSRSNEQDIRHAQGADQTIDPAARDAGFASLCKRTDFAANPANRLRCPHPAVVAGARPGP